MTPSATVPKQEPSATASPKPDDDADVRATTAMAIVELLASDTASPYVKTAASEPAHVPTADSASPLWVDSRLHRKSSVSSSTSSSASTPSSTSQRDSSNAMPFPSFPALPSLLPMKRPLWQTSSSSTASPGAGFKSSPVPIQPLPSIAQLSKLAIASNGRLSPTAIDSLATSTGATTISSSPVMAATPPVARAPAAVLPGTAPTTATAPAAAPASVNHSRKRQKDELDKLRVQVQELQRELEHVRGRLPKKPVLTFTLAPRDGSSSSNGSGSSESATGALQMALLPSSVTVWERIATHQKEQKNRSEMENMKLKAMVQEQVKISRALEKLVNKRCKTSALEAKFATKRLRVCDADEQQLFDALRRDVDARYPHVNAVFQALGMLVAGKRETQEAHMILDPVNGPTMELRDATIFPFDVNAITNAVWRSMEAEAMGCAEGMGLVESLVVHCTDDTIFAKTTIPLRQPRAEDAELCVRVVVKRFVERERVVVLWESLSDRLGKLPLACPLLAGLGASLPRDVAMRDRGWCLIEALPSAPGRHASMVQLCSHIAPQAVGPSSSSTESSASLSLQHMQSLVDALTPCYRSIWGNRQQIMENILMENVVGMPRAGASPWSSDAAVAAAAVPTATASVL